MKNSGIINYSRCHGNLKSLHFIVRPTNSAVFDKLIISLRTSYANEYSLDKEQTSYSDNIDALRLACKLFRMK